MFAKYYYPTILAGLTMGLCAYLIPEAYQFMALFMTVIIITASGMSSIYYTVSSGLTLGVVLHLVSLQEALVGYKNPAVWLVVMAFGVAQAVATCGIGKRIALWLMHRLGGSYLGMGYAICIAECLFAPIIPSNVARGGGIIAPIVQAVIQQQGTTEKSNQSEVSAYLILVAAHANNISSAMFLTAMVANPLIAQTAREVFEVDFTWGLWFLGASLPGFCSLLATPWLIGWFTISAEYKEIKDTTAIKDNYHQLGSWTTEEKRMVGVMLFLLFGWATAPLHGLHPALVAFVGIIAIALLRVCTVWSMVSDIRAWQTLVWLGGMVSLGHKLHSDGVVVQLVESMYFLHNGLSQEASIGLVWLVYFYAMYFFAGSTAYVAMLYGAMLMLVKSLSVPALPAIATLAYASNLNPCLTSYSTGTMAMYFSYRYVDSRCWYTSGFCMSILHMVFWLFIGSFWWKFLGWW